MVEAQTGMTCERHLQANGFSGEHQHRVPPPAVKDAGTQRVRGVSAGPIDHTTLPAVHVNGMGGFHAHRVRQIHELQSWVEPAATVSSGATSPMSNVRPPSDHSIR